MHRRTFLAWCAALILGSTALARADQTQVKDVVYRHKLGVALTMDVFKPDKPNGIGILWMVSGGWMSSHDAINADLARAFTSRGMTVFQVVHGTQPRFTLPEIIEDIHRAVRFVRTNAATWGVDPNKLGISGGSAGGHLSLTIGAYGAPGPQDAKDPVDRASSKVQAIACLFPPTDFLNYGKEGQSAMKVPMLRVFWPAFGITDQTPADEVEKLGKTLSPIYGDLKNMPPTLIIHGDADPLVPIQQSQRIIAKLEELKVPCKLEVRPGKAHGWPGIESEATVLAEWFEKYLK